MKHTPTPWVNNFSGKQVYQLYGGKPIANIEEQEGERYGFKHNDTERLANAEFIVRACNSHYELLDALEALLEKVNHHNQGILWSEQILARDAIRKAKGERS